ncbi:MAG TPA: hypothetical protein VGN15_08690 [Ktedonobacteraceae bacterium]|jgi:phosphatidylserine/phosphatidylglycerophosphate/cardiolipin synthase-like enzyme|nr:hypothetical protein [Ktedonobacteraceae bacterium]
MATTWATPEDLVAPTLDLIRQATESIRMLIVGPAHEEVIDLLVAKVQEGIDVQLLLEHSSVAGRRTMTFQRERLRDEGVQFLAATADTMGKELLRNGWLVVDGRYVLRGHWNFGSEAQVFNWLALEDDTVEGERLYKDFLSISQFVKDNN